MTDTILNQDLGNGIAVMTLNRGPVNAISAGFLADVEAHLKRLENDPAVRGVIVASAFKVFSAGLDLKEAQVFSLEDQVTIVDNFTTAFAAMYRFPKPVVAAVSGAAIAGGLFFVLSADYAVTHPDARFGLAEVRVGASFPVGPLEIARATLPAPALNRLMLTGRPVTAHKAMDIGFIDEVVAAGDILQRAEAAALDLIQTPPKTYATIKLQARAPALAIIDEAIANKSDPLRQGWFTDETKAAMKAMIG
ncbi:MAG: enoyl-CoA hydratase/isomerase family protein [Rhizobiales bacterium]|nr:enoyl-CoA hydratase/isomerase family protein [Hyphomicrobiales bacterium]